MKAYMIQGSLRRLKLKCVCIGLIAGLIPAIIFVILWLNERSLSKNLNSELCQIHLENGSLKSRLMKISGNAEGYRGILVSKYKWREKKEK